MRNVFNYQVVRGDLALFDQQDPAEINSPDFPRAAGRLPQPGAGRRTDPESRRPLAATGKLLISRSAYRQ